MPGLLTRAYRRVASARPEDLRFAARAWLLAPVVEASLAGAGLRRTLMLLSLAKRAGSARRDRPCAARMDHRTATEWTARAFALTPFDGLCLARSIVQHTLHALDGTPSRLVVGVRRLEPGLAAHAWVTAPGEHHPGEHSTETDGFLTIFADEAPGWGGAPT